MSTGDLAAMAGSFAPESAARRIRCHVFATDDGYAVQVEDVAKMADEAGTCMTPKVTRTVLGMLDTMNHIGRDLQRSGEIHRGRAQLMNKIKKTVHCRMVRSHKADRCLMILALAEQRIKHERRRDAALLLSAAGSVPSVPEFLQWKAAQEAFEATDKQLKSRMSWARRERDAKGYVSPVRVPWSEVHED